MTVDAGRTVTGWDPLCDTDWPDLLAQEFEERYWGKLQSFVHQERSHYDVYPLADQVFAAMCITQCADTKAVILGQDPYHGPGQAHGLCFSVPSGVDRPPSLVNIHKELKTDLGIERPNHGSLEAWAGQGVLLLNTTLTVRAGDPGSHFGRGWEDFTDAVIRVVAQKSDPVFIPWGEKAQRKADLITRITGFPGKIIKSSHPAPQSAYRPCQGSQPFIGSEPFTKANGLLKGDGISWNLDSSDC